MFYKTKTYLSFRNTDNSNVFLKLLNKSFSFLTSMISFNSFKISGIKLSHKISLHHALNSSWNEKVYLIMHVFDMLHLHNAKGLLQRDLSMEVQHTFITTTWLQHDWSLKVRHLQRDICPKIQILMRSCFCGLNLLYSFVFQSLNTPFRK